jgi:hypothetical protein
LFFLVLNDDQTALFDKSWHDWTGASLIVADLAKVYPIRQVACYKGVNVVPVIHDRKHFYNCNMVPAKPVI